MFAVIKAGGRQYRVAADDVIEVDRISGNAGDQVAFDQVLMLGGPDGSTVGTPVVDGASVAGELVDQTRSPKVIAFKKRRRQNSRRTRGHRQHLSLVRITEILTGGKKAASTKAAARPKAKAQESVKGPGVKAVAKTEEAFARPAGEPNDLKLISGVGPVLERKLNAIGITRFDQIEAFSADDVAKVDDLLNFKGRIERDGWVAQAAELAKSDGQA